MRYAPNLVESKLTEGNPWDFIDISLIPAPARADKCVRTAWLQNPNTQYNAWTAYEGLNPHLRISNGENGNPLARMHAIVVDYDHPLSDLEINEAISKMAHRPTYWERTLSGNARLLWCFRTPIRVSKDSIFFAFQDHVFKTLRLDWFLPGFDKSAWNNETLLFTNGAVWHKTGAEPLDDDLVRGWLVVALREQKNDVQRTPAPFEKIVEALTAKYPRFSEWPGEFALGGNGPSFWVDGSKSPNSAFVHEWGIYTFSRHAHKEKYTWADLLGQAWVDEHHAKQIGTAVDDVWFDGREYWYPGKHGIFHSSSKEDTKEHLRIRRGLSPQRGRAANASPLDEAMEYIRTEQRITAAVPFAGRPHGKIVMVGNDRYLNTARVTLITPAPTGEWGRDFPFIQSLLESMFGWDEDTLYAFLAWLWFFFRGLRDLEPEKGHNLIIMGEPNCGKTLLSQEVVGYIAGGVAEGTRYMIGMDSFGGELFERNVIVCDDAESSGSSNAKRKFSELAKALAANQKFRYHKKFKDAQMTEWCGRFIHTLNCDPRSQMELPDLNNSSWDKFMLLRARRSSGFEFPRSRKEIREAIHREAPYFLAWLLARTPEADTWLNERIGDARFGVKTYHDPMMRVAVNQSGEAAAFKEMLVRFQDMYFAEHKGEEAWEGTASDLWVALQGHNFGKLIESKSTTDVQRVLAMLQSHPDMRIEEKTDSKSHVRRWRIFRPNYLPREREPQLSGNSSKFTK